MGEDKKSVSSVKNPNAVFVALGVVAMVILAGCVVPRWVQPTSNTGAISI